MINVNINTRDFQRTIKSIESSRIEKRDIDSVIKKIADELQSNAKRDCPVDTGLLQSRIKVEKVTDGYKVFVDDVYYDIFVHDGTRFMPPRPFLLGANVLVAETALLKEIDKLIRRKG